MKQIAMAGIATAAILLLIAVLGAFFWVFPGPDTNESITHTQYIQKLRFLSATDKSICPDLLVPLRGTGKSDCLHAAIDSNRPFWLSMQFYPMGNHETSWIGLARNKKGQLWYVIFAPDISGGYADKKKPYLSVSQCHGIIAPADMRQPPSCANWP